jgi:hypothetical protein
MELIVPTMMNMIMRKKTKWKNWSMKLLKQKICSAIQSKPLRSTSALEVTAIHPKLKLKIKPTSSTWPNKPKTQRTVSATASINSYTMRTSKRSRKHSGPTLKITSKTIWV